MGAHAGEGAPAIHLDVLGTRVGLGVGITWPIAMGAIQGWNRLPVLFPLSLIGFPIAGYVGGGWMWKKMEGEYEKAMGTRGGGEGP